MSGLSLHLTRKSCFIAVKVIVTPHFKEAAEALLSLSFLNSSFFQLNLYSSLCSCDSLTVNRSEEARQYDVRKSFGDLWSLAYDI